MTNDVFGSAESSRSVSAPQWRRRVRGALLAGACADGLCRALPSAGVPAGGEFEGFASPHCRSELESGPITARTVVLAYQLLRRYGTMPDPAAALSGPDMHTVDHLPAAWITPIGLQGAVPFVAMAAEARRVAALLGADDVGCDVTAAQAIAVAGHRPAAAR